MKKKLLAGIMALCLVGGTNVLEFSSSFNANASREIEPDVDIVDDIPQETTGTDEIEIINSGKWGKSGTWTLDVDGLLTISGTGSFPGLNDKINYTEISKVEGIKVEDGITEIGADAFKDYDKLMYIELPETITIINAKAFYDCDSLYDIQLPDSLINIGASAFYSCDKLSSIKLPENLESIDESAFENCKGLHDIKIPEKVVSIGSSAFEECTSLYNVELPDNLTNLSPNLFYYCKALKSIKLPANLTSIGKNAFYNCIALSEIELPVNLKSIDYEAFKLCKALTSIVIPDNVTSIGSNAFSSSGLAEITLGSKIQTIGMSAFDNTGIESAIYRGSKKSWSKVSVDHYNDPLEDHIICIAEPGDANGDGETSIADAVLIMQALSNSDEYSLSDIGEINADVLDNDGVSSADALVIQMVVANTITSDVLPLTSEELAELTTTAEE